MVADILGGMKFHRHLLAPALALATLVPVVDATWSLVVVNTETGEVCVATATCLSGFDLQAGVPVIKVGVGAAAAQSFVSYTNKVKIYDGFTAGDSPATILAFLAATDGGHQTRQYGIVNLADPSVSFTGTSAGIAKEDLIGSVGPYKYAIQGNVLTGDAVVFAAEAAFIGAPGDLSQKVMVAMEAARALGGDGRCSCSPSAPTSCGVPPPSFTKSAHVATIQTARFGDTDLPCGGTSVGCSAGVYYLDLNVIGFTSDPDPVFTLQTMYDAWRAGLVGRPDHVLSTATPTADRLPADGLTSMDVTVELADIDGTPLGTGGATLSVSTADGGPALTTIGGVTDHGDGTYSFTLTAGSTVGTETLAIVADDGAVQATLYPYLAIEVEPATSFHAGFDAISAGAGASVPMVVDFGLAKAGQPYIALASAAGTSPGFPLPGGALLPLNPDPFTTWTFLNPGAPILPGSIGALDSSGRTDLSFIIPGGIMAGAIGLRLDWAAITLAAPLTPTVADGFHVLP